MRSEAMHAERSIKPLNTKSLLPRCFWRHARRGNHGENLHLAGQRTKISTLPVNGGKTLHLAGATEKTFHLAGQRRFFNSADQPNLETFDQKAALEEAAGRGRQRCRLDAQYLPATERAKRTRDSFPFRYFCVLGRGAEFPTLAHGEASGELSLALCAAREVTQSGVSNL